MAMDEERQVNQTEQGEQRTEEPAAGERSSRRPTLRSLSRLLLLLAVVLVIVVLTTMEDGNHFASLRRWLMYGDSGTGQNYYTYAADSSNRFALLGEDLLVVNQNAIQLLEDDGSIRYNLPVSVVEPMVSVAAARRRCADVGGQQPLPPGQDRRPPGADPLRRPALLLCPTQQRRLAGGDRGKKRL